MTPELIGKTTILFAAIVLCAVGVWHNDKLVVFEKKIYEFACDRIGYIAAMVYVKYRRRKIDRSIRRVERALDILDKETLFLRKLKVINNERNQIYQSIRHLSTPGQPSQRTRRPYRAC